MPGSWLARWVVLAAVLSMLGCGDSYELDLAQVEYFNLGARVEAPTSVAVGESFELTVGTYGGGCILEGSTEVELADIEADVTPYDRYLTGDGTCTADLRFYDHVGELRFDTAGEKTIRIHGRRVADDVDEVIEIPVSVQVE